MNCPKCQCSEISASGMCLWCGYQVNAPGAENGQGVKGDRDTSSKVDITPPAESEGPVSGRSDLGEAKSDRLAASQSPAAGSHPRADWTRYSVSSTSVSSREVKDLSEPRRSTPEPAWDATDSIPDRSSGRGIPAQTQEMPAAARFHSPMILLIRTFSGLVDLLIMALSTGVLILAVHFFWGMHVRDPKSFVHWSVLFTVVYFLYSLFFVGISNQTIGMMLTNLRVVAGRDERSPQFASVLGRSCAYLVSVLCLGIGLLWALLDPEYQCFHDRITNTRVVRLAPSNSKNGKRN